MGSLTWQQEPKSVAAVCRGHAVEAECSRVSGHEHMLAMQMISDIEGSANVLTGNLAFDASEYGEWATVTEVSEVCGWQYQEGIIIPTMFGVSDW